MPNRLARETSPYLKQHQDNPVDWYPWGDEALNRARAEDKPILLSVGYSACHWCHVMAHESFENPDTARLMNESFINIKVDREERPDLDQIYQNVAQVMTRGGGWPLTVFLTPELKPFFGGTYFPPEDRWGRPGFPRVLEALARAYREEREHVAENAKKLTEAIASLEAAGAPAGSEKGPGLSWELLDSAARELASEFDWENGGFGGAPKFPNVPMLGFLWRMGLAGSNADARAATLLALRKMAEGGIYDQLGGGFSRYSVDGEWKVPHFEKMLYDNGQLLRLYAEVLLTGGELAERGLFERVARETADYLLREMEAPGGGYYSAQDADSEGEEGKFFAWTEEELDQLLTPEEARVAKRRFGFVPGGNFEHGKTVLRIAEEPDEASRALVESARRKLFAAREKRVRPGLDDKILVSWNGLAIGGLAWAAEALGEPRARDAAVRAFDRLVEACSAPSGRLSSTLQAGKPRFNAYLDDYASLAWAALELARFERDPARVGRYVDLAVGWARVILAHFKDLSAPGFYFTSDDHEALLQRPKGLFDQAFPSGNSLSLGLLIALGELVPERMADAAAQAGRELELLLRGATRNVFGHGELLWAGLLAQAGPVAVGGGGASELARNPFVFQKAPDPAVHGLLICHRQACSAPLQQLSEARDRVSRLLARS